MRDNLKTTICQCGVDLKNVNQSLKLLTKTEVLGFDDPKFYGGIVDKFAFKTCKCGKEYLCYLKQVSGGWEVKDMELVETTTSGYVQTTPINNDIGEITTNNETPQKQIKADLSNIGFHDLRKLGRTHIPNYNNGFTKAKTIEELKKIGF